MCPWRCVLNARPIATLAPTTGPFQLLRPVVSSKRGQHRRSHMQGCAATSAIHTCSPSLQTPAIIRSPWSCQNAMHAQSRLVLSTVCSNSTARTHPLGDTQPPPVGVPKQGSRFHMCCNRLVPAFQQGQATLVQLSFKSHPFLLQQLLQPQLPLLLHLLPLHSSLLLCALGCS